MLFIRSYLLFLIFLLFFSDPIKASDSDSDIPQSESQAQEQAQVSPQPPTGIVIPTINIIDADALHNSAVSGEAHPGEGSGDDQQLDSDYSTDNSFSDDGDESGDDNVSTSQPSTSLLHRSYKVKSIMIALIIAQKIPYVLNREKVMVEVVTNIKNYVTKDFVNESDRIEITYELVENDVLGIAKIKAFGELVKAIPLEKRVNGIKVLLQELSTVEDLFFSADGMSALRDLLSPEELGDVSLIARMINSLNLSRFSNVWGMKCLKNIFSNLDFEHKLSLIDILSESEGVGFSEIAKHKSIISLIKSDSIDHWNRIILMNNLYDSSSFKNVEDEINASLLYLRGGAREKMLELNLEKLREIAPKDLPDIGGEENLEGEQVIKRFEAIVNNFNEDIKGLYKAEAVWENESDATHNTAEKVLKNLFVDTEEKVAYPIPEKNRNDVKKLIKHLIIKFEQMINDGHKEEVLPYLTTIMLGFQHCSSRQVEEPDAVVSALIKQQQVAPGFMGEVFAMINKLKVDAFNNMLKNNFVQMELDEKHNANIVSQIRSIIKAEFGLPSTISNFIEYIAKITIIDVANYEEMYIDNYFNKDVIIGYLTKKISDEKLHDLFGLYLSFLSDEEKLAISDYNEYFGDYTKPELIEITLKKMRILN